MSSYQYRKSHCGDKMVVRSSYLHNGISYTGETTSLYWIRALMLKHRSTSTRSTDSIFIVLNHFHTKILYSLWTASVYKKYFWWKTNITQSFKDIYSLRPSDVIWRHRTWSILAQVMTCCLTAPSHYLNQCWRTISGVHRSFKSDQFH